MSKLSLVNEVGHITGSKFKDYKSMKRVFEVKPKYVRLNRECLGENIARGREEDLITSPNPLG